MSKRKRQDSVNGDEVKEADTKKEEIQNLKTPKKTEVDVDKVPKDAIETSEKTLPGSSEKEKVNNVKGTKRKRTEKAEEEPVSKQVKRDISLRKGKTVKRPIAKKIVPKRLSKNECVCSPDGSKPVQIPEEENAHIQVEEWRLHKFQSPIELNHEESIHHDHFEPLEFHGHWDKEGEGTFTNNGFTATLRFHNRELPILKGGPLHDDHYVFEQLHFHWSDDDHSGCEHIFEGRAYSMEAHAVHFNQKYSDFTCAQNKPDGLAVVAFFIQATDNENNPCFDKLTTAVKDIIKINSVTKVQPDCLTWFKDAAQCKGYYTYQGSLTTKPYTESVTWILYPQPIHVSREQVASFRNLKSTPCEQHNITKNVRPIQTPPEHKKLNVFFARSHRHSTSE